MGMPPHELASWSGAPRGHTTEQALPQPVLGEGPLPSQPSTSRKIGQQCLAGTSNCSNRGSRSASASLTAESTPRFRRPAEAGMYSGGHGNPHRDAAYGRQDVA
eukprot:15432505-Alexandrium_andersonii.AAC.1